MHAMLILAAILYYNGKIFTAADAKPWVQGLAADRFALDSAAPNHPVLLSAWYGHGTFLNSKAIQVMGLAEDEPDPFGGFYDRMPGTNILNGVAHEYAEHLVRRYFATQMTDAELQSLYESFAAAAARTGYTSLQELSIGVPQERHLRVLSKSRLPVRWRAICLPLDLNESCAIPSGFAQTSQLTASGIKWVADGTYIEHAAFQEQDYADAPGNPWLDLFFAQLQPTRPAEALTIEEAVIAYTRTAAEAEFQEQRKGTLEPGKLADFVALSQDIFSLPKDHPETILGTFPVLTVVGGKTVYSRSAQ
jgi:predicted amidohydrolase YtcJ